GVVVGLGARVADVLRRRRDALHADALVDLAVLVRAAVRVARAASPAVTDAVLGDRRVGEAAVFARAALGRAAVLVVGALRDADAAVVSGDADAGRARVVGAVAVVELGVADRRARRDDADRRRVVARRREDGVRAFGFLRAVRRRAVGVGRAGLADGAVVRARGRHVGLRRAVGAGRNHVAARGRVTRRRVGARVSDVGHRTSAPEQ